MGYFDSVKAAHPARATGTDGPVVVQLRAEGDGDTTYGLRALQSEASIVATASQGERNDTLNRAWFRMGRLISGGQLTAPTARQALADAATQAGLPAGEIDLVLRSDDTSAVSAAAATPRTPEPLAPVPEVTVLPEPTGDPEVDADALSEAVRKRFPILDWDELWTRETHEEWIVEPILPARRLVALFSPPKVGKSLLMLEIAVAVAGRRPILGVLPDRARRVLYVDFENDPESDVRERLKAMGLSPQELQNLCYLSYPTIAKFDTPTGALELMAAVAEYECEVVVIDTISRAVAGEENENDTWLAFYRNTGLALKQAGVACIRLDHTGKDHDKGMRGGSAKYGDVDAVWKLSTVVDGQTYRLECTDHRMPIGETTLVLQRRAVPHLHHQVDGEGRAAATRARVDQIIDALDEMDVDKRAGSTVVRDALKNTGIKAGNSLIAAAIKERKTRAGLLWVPEEDDE